MEAGASASRHPGWEAVPLDNQPPSLPSPAPPAPPPPTFFELLLGPEIRIYFGLVLALLAVFFIALGAGLQRHALDRIDPELRIWDCVSKRSWRWFLGLSVYFFANVLYTLALVYAPASLCATLMAMIVPLNALTSRCVLDEVQQTADVQGGVLIMTGIGVAAWAAPYDSEVLTAPELEQLLLAPRSLALLSLLVGTAVVLGSMILAYEGAARSRSADDVDGALCLTAVSESGLVEMRCNMRAAMPFAYPVVVGLLESLVQIFQKGGTMLLTQRALGGADGSGHELTTTLMLGGWALTSLAVVWWLRKGLGALPASRLLPVECAL